MSQKKDLPNFSVVDPAGYQLQPHEYAQPALLLPEQSIFYTPMNAIVPNNLGRLVLHQQTPALTDYDQVDFLSERDGVDFSRVFKIRENVYGVDDSYLNITSQAYMRDRFTMDVEKRSTYDFSSPDFAPVVAWAGNEAQLKTMLEDIANEYNWNADPRFLEEYEVESEDRASKLSDQDF